MVSSNAVEAFKMVELGDREDIIKKASEDQSTPSKKLDVKAKPY